MRSSVLWVCGLYTTGLRAIIRRARRAVLMNIDVPRRYASLEVNVLALLTLWGIESEQTGAAARRKRKYARDSVVFLFNAYLITGGLYASARVLFHF